MGAVLVMLFVDTVLYTVLFLYSDAVLPIGPGAGRLHPLFFLDKAWWAGHLSRARPETAKVSSSLSSTSSTRTGSNETNIESLALPPEPDEPADVQEERERVLRQQVGGVRAIGLSKTYQGRTKPAVVNVQFGVEKGECFGLLGSNGAGKTTVIHMLCGLHPPSHGTMLAGDDGLDLRTSLREIQSAMGVCSQDNLLWEELTGAEHLRFFARLRRVPKAAIEKHVNFWLRQVGLHSTSDRRKRSHAFSGGMKRRLGVANALIGNPQIVFLDEPSTGLDPQVRTTQDQMPPTSEAHMHSHLRGPLPQTLSYSVPFRAPLSI